MSGPDEAAHDPFACVEHSIWTPVPERPPAAIHDFTLSLKDVDPTEEDRVKRFGALTFHTVGCTGDFANHDPQRSVVEAMTAQILDPAGARGPAGPAPSFLFHLGDVVYKDDKASDPDRDDQVEMYNAQFYGPNTTYPRRIFAIAGNHDGKQSPERRKSAIDHFLLNFCARRRGISPDNQTDGRHAMMQPYVYWRLDTPLASIIGLYTNIANGGILDDPSRRDDGAQYRWLVAQLADLEAKRADKHERRALLLAMHYPPYSGTSHFAQRGDPTLGPTNAEHALPLGAVLQRALAESGMRPDAVLSAHTHLYQRLTYSYADGWEIPYLVVGGGGHTPIENMWTACDGSPGQPQTVPFDAVSPPGLTLPAGDRLSVAAYEDQHFGFLRMTVAPGRLTGEHFTVGAGVATVSDAFTLDLREHRLQDAG